MARKNLFAGLSAQELPAGNFSESDRPEGPAAPHLGVMGTRGAIGAVTRSIEQLKAQAVIDLPPDFIDASVIRDRLETSPEALRELMESIREHGQQVPILVRPHPEKEGRYQIAYGRRRLKALAELGRTVRAIVKTLTDAQLVVAQGQENSARTDLSFIEKALFAAKLEEGGYSRETIMASLSIDKTGLSRLISAASKIPASIIEAIGPAPKAGRDRWSELAVRLDSRAPLEAAERLMAEASFAGRESDERFNAVFLAAAPRKKAAPKPTVVKADDGSRVASVKEDARSLTVAFDRKTAGAFGSYLVEQLPELYAAFKRRADQ